MPTIRPLFDANVLERAVKEHIRKSKEPEQRLKDIVEHWFEQIKNGYLSSYTETQVEQAFIGAIFVDVLGYQPIGRANTHHIVPKRTGATGRDIPDFVLGTFTPGTRTERWRAVGEIKTLRTNLDAPQTSRYNQESPIDQAFRYALTGRPGVEWIIVTNFNEIRLYRNGYRAAYHSWTLKELCEKKAFNEFYTLLKRENLAPDSGQSELISILEASIDADLHLTDGFYGLYDLARLEMLKALNQQPPCNKLSETEILGKAHKLLNRALFASFCEDHPAALLPPNTVQRLYEKASTKRGKHSYWNTFQNFFNELDKGSPPGTENAFHAFNGGLFAPDEVIDKMKIPNGIFTKSLTFKEKRRASRTIKGVFGFHVYDFATELDVNCLGTIFEQSLKDLPHLLRAVRGKSDQDLTRRQTRGVYYTNEAITTYLVKHALDALLEPEWDKRRKEIDAQKSTKRLQVGKAKLKIEETRDVKFLQAQMDRLQEVKICDPACGSGAFLIRAFDAMMDQYETVNSALGDIMGARPLFGLNSLILRENLHGIDILPESVEITKLSLWLRTASKTEPLESLDSTIIAKDTITSEDTETYDIVVSNPPWGGDLPNWTTDEIKERFPTCGEEKDTYAIFVIRAYEMLKENGILAFILPNSWLTVDGYSSFRKWLLEVFSIIEIIHVWKIFEDVNHDACLLIARKKPLSKEAKPSVGETDTIIRSVEKRNVKEKAQHLAEERWDHSFEVNQESWMEEPGTRFETIYPPKVATAIDQAWKQCIPLSECCDVTVGIQVYHRRKVPVEVIKNKAFHSTTRKGKDWYPYITGNEVQRYYQVPSESAFLYYSEQLCDKRELEHYKEPRILVQQLFWNRISACYHVPDEPFLYLNTIFSISNPNDDVSLPYILALLNSQLVSAAYQRFTNRLFGEKFPKVSKIDLARLPIPIVGTKERKRLERAGASLTEQWSAFKSALTDYHDYLLAIDSKQQLLKHIGKPWMTDKEQVISAIRSSLKVAKKDLVKEILDESSEQRRDSNNAWSKIQSKEVETEELVRNAYKIPRNLYATLIERAPEVKIEDALLPK